MAKIKDKNRDLVSGKFNRKDPEIHRVRNGKEHVYTQNVVNNPNTKAQKNTRGLFGKTNSIVNVIMADPVQCQEWRHRLNEFNETHYRYHTSESPFKTLRQFIYHVISQQLANKPSARRRKAALPYSLPKGYTLRIKPFTDLTTAEIYEILKARFAVFVGEQHIHYLDEDNIDYTATHFTIHHKGLVVAYARLYPGLQQGTLALGRMLTTERGKGFAGYLLRQIIDEARRQGATKLTLHAQMQAVIFYEHFGFKTVGDIFEEAELPHINMELNL